MTARLPGVVSFEVGGTRIDFLDRGEPFTADLKRAVSESVLAERERCIAVMLRELAEVGAEGEYIAARIREGSP